MTISLLTFHTLYSLNYFYSSLIDKILILFNQFNNTSTNHDHLVSIYACRFLISNWSSDFLLIFLWDASFNFMLYLFL